MFRRVVQGYDYARRAHLLPHCRIPPPLRCARRRRRRPQPYVPGLKSKSSCPFCTRVKQLLAQLGASYKAVELDVESDGSELQTTLANWTGQRTVPNVFIKGKHIGGCDDTMALQKRGSLVPLLTEAGAIATSSL